MSTHGGAFLAALLRRLSIYTLYNAAPKMAAPKKSVRKSAAFLILAARF
jgi:hypothetical protein